jgi:hypothetical protein
LTYNSPTAPFEDLNDHIHPIAHGLDLHTIIWQYDSNDWRAGTGNVTAATADGNYEALIMSAKNGVFDTVRVVLFCFEMDVRAPTVFFWASCLAMGMLFDSILISPISF